MNHELYKVSPVDLAETLAEEKWWLIKEYETVQQTNYYRVKAKTEEDAEEAWREGNADMLDTDVNDSDVDSHEVELDGNQDG